MHEQVLSRACFCDVVGDVNEDLTLAKFYKVGQPQPFLIATYTRGLDKWSMQYNGDIFFEEYALLSDLIRFVCLLEFKEGIETKYPYSQA